MVSHRNERKQDEGSDEESSSSAQQQGRHRVRYGRVERETRQRWERHNEALARINGDIEAQVLGCSVTNHAVSMAIASHGLAVPPLSPDLIEPRIPGSSQLMEYSILSEAVSLAIREKGLRPLSPTNT